MLPALVVGAGVAVLAGASIDAFKGFLSDKGLPRYFQRFNQHVLGRAQGTNLADFTQPARMEPWCLIDESLTNYPNIRDILDTNLSIYSSYVLQAVSLDTTIAGVSLMQRVDKFSTNRSLVAGGRSILTESSFGLPFGKQKDESVRLTNKAINETLKKYRTEGFLQDYIDKTEPIEEHRTASQSNELNDDVTRMATEVGNLAVGKIYNVRLENNGQKATMLMTITLRVNRYPTDILTGIMSVGSQDNSFKARSRLVKAGLIKQWRDGIMCMDLMDEHYAIMIRDKTRYYQTMYERANQNLIAEMISGEPSIGTESSIIVITKETAARVESQIGGKLSTFEVRQRVFGRTMSIILAVVNTDRDMITYYIRGLQTPTELSMAEIKYRGRNGGNDDLKAIMTMLMEGRGSARLI